MKAERAIAQLLGAPDVSSPEAQKALRNLAGAGSGAIPILIDAFASADRHQSNGIADALSKLINDSNFDTVAHGLEHPNDRCVAGTAKALSAANNFSASKLLQLMHDDDISKHAESEFQTIPSAGLSRTDLADARERFE